MKLFLLLTGKPDKSENFAGGANEGGASIEESI